MRISVDGDKCTGHGRCYTTAPDLLQSDDEGFVTIRGSSLEVPQDQQDAARRAFNACPEDAISLLEGDHAID